MKFNTVMLEGYETGIIRRLDSDWRIYPPREVMRASGLLPDTAYMTVKLDNGGIALIPIDEKELFSNEKD